VDLVDKLPDGFPQVWISSRWSLEHSMLEAAGAKCSRFEGVRFSACTGRHMQIMPKTQPDTQRMVREMPASRCKFYESVYKENLFQTAFWGLGHALHLDGPKNTAVSVLLSVHKRISRGRIHEILVPDLLVLALCSFAAAALVCATRPKNWKNWD